MFPRRVAQQVCHTHAHPNNTTAWHIAHVSRHLIDRAIDLFSLTNSVATLSPMRFIMVITNNGYLFRLLECSTFGLSGVSNVKVVRDIVLMFSCVRCGVGGARGARGRGCHSARDSTARCASSRARALCAPRASHVTLRNTPHLSHPLLYHKLCSDNVKMIAV